MSVYLVACGKTKRGSRSLAKDLYTSTLFKFARSLAEREGDRWFILSARHGLVDPEGELDPYNQSLVTAGRAERRAWAVRVYLQALRVGAQQWGGVTFLAGSAYQEPLGALLAQLGLVVEDPMKGLGVGKRLQWMKRRLSEESRG